MAVKQLWTTPPQFVDANGGPYSGALLFFYVGGSVNTKQNTYTDSGGGTPCSNPITLNSSGYPAISGTIVAPWGTVGQTYKIGLAAPGSSDPPASFIWTEDDVAPINDTSVTADQWVSGPAPTYIGATSFSLVGDQTSDFQVGRRLKTTNSGGTIYSTITVSAYGAVTTVTVVNDSGVLDAGLSAVSYGLFSATNPSVPILADTNFLVSGSADLTKKIRFEVDGLTTATTRVLTAPNQDSRIGITLATEQASTSGASIDFTGIPAGVKRITVMFKGVSTNGTSNPLIQLGDAGGFEATGYLGASVSAIGTDVACANYTTGFGLIVADAASIFHGSIVLTLENSAAFTWVANGLISRSDATPSYWTSGSKSLSAELTQVRITTVNGSDAFDAGAINISYE